MNKVIIFLLLLFPFISFCQIDSTKILDEVVVTGQYSPQPLRNSVYKVRTITAERILKRGATDITGVLNSELGIRFATDNLLGETDTRIMGIGGSRVKILIDGIPVIDRDATKQSLTQIDINSIEKIEIVEGPMSVQYGSDALAGVINIITKKGKSSGSNIHLGVRVQEESVASTYSPFTDEGIHNENISLGWNNNYWKASGYVTRNNFGGFRSGASFPAKLFKPKDQLLSGGSIGYQHGILSAWYRLDYANEKILAANALNPNNYISVQQHFITNRYMHQLQADWLLHSNIKLNTSAAYQDYKRSTETYDKNYSTGTSTINNPAGAGLWDISAFKSIFFRTTLAWILSPKLSVQPGVDIKNDKTSGQRISGTPSITDYSFFISSEYTPAKSISLRPGFRFTDNSVYKAPPVIPSLNTKFRLDEHFDLRLSYARGFRAPILRELYFNFVDANHSIKGNPLLKAESSNSYMASLSFTTVAGKKLNYNSSLSTFFNDYHNFIDVYSYKDANNADVFSYFNLGRYKNLGATWENTVVYHSLTASVGASYIAYYNELQQDAALKGNRDNFSWTPELTANISYRFIPLQLDLGLYYKYTGRIPSFGIDAANNNNIILAKRDDFHWADLTATKKLFQFLSIQGGIKNLFNVKNLNSSATINGGAHSTGSTINYAYGRSFFIGINFQLDKSLK